MGVNIFSKKSLCKLLSEHENSAFIPCRYIHMDGLMCNIDPSSINVYFGSTPHPVAVANEGL